MAAAYESRASSAASRAVMQANRRRDTSPEMTVRRLVHAQGLRYQVDTKPLPALNRRADLVFATAKVAVLVDGCYWHGCPEHGTVAQTNATYWRTKIARNRERDDETNKRLADAGWLPLRAWEHEDPEAVVARIIDAVRCPSSGANTFNR
ncbi:very short patch repair endonuclease [Nocardioides dokdonensis]|uniref:very short patch repair endonuclease n=1 Tax=Nocardioides dokdonensis TaxID=450734 RepID=UPI000A028CB0|nr:very short patch repair endonuclease [Nocardioides dokdonensis]